MSGRFVSGSALLCTLLGVARLLAPRPMELQVADCTALLGNLAVGLAIYARFENSSQTRFEPLTQKDGEGGRTLRSGSPPANGWLACLGVQLAMQFRESHACRCWLFGAST
ncbi:hypothetical protein BKA56DRAFT_610409 [Ilyonectria sp. MPI-CAGE-AT-0026]|nr:hypothetical protein BKA56DRAFT_610409 [Ilyonectria sp. MPI-CAGE-AT-0026]